MTFVDTCISNVNNISKAFIIFDDYLKMSP